MATLRINYIVPHTEVYVSVNGTEYKRVETEYTTHELMPGVSRIKVKNTFGDDDISFYWYLWHEEKQRCAIITGGSKSRTCTFLVPENAKGVEDLDVDVYDYTHDRRWFFAGEWEITTEDFTFS